MAIGTEHNGYSVLYNETDNSWHCPQLSLHSDSLAALRRLIDAFDADSQRLTIAAFLIDHSGFSITPVTVVRADAESGWIINRLDDPRGERREKVGLNRLVEDTAENRQLLLAWRDASRAVYEEGLRVAQFRDSIPRMDGKTPAARPPQAVRR